MSRTSYIYIFCFLVTTTFAVPVFAQTHGALRCPATLTHQAKSYPLSRFSIFDGAPEELADLIPDDDTGWKLDGYRSTARKLYLVCTYENTNTTARFVIPENMKFCALKGKNVECH